MFSSFFFPSLLLSSFLTSLPHLTSKCWSILWPSPLLFSLSSLGHSDLILSILLLPTAFLGWWPSNFYFIEFHHFFPPPLGNPACGNSKWFQPLSKSTWRGLTSKRNPALYSLCIHFMYYIFTCILFSDLAL